MIPLLPEAASTLAHRTDATFFALLGLAFVILTIVIGLTVVFAMRYRRGSPAARGPLPKWLERDLEIGWTSATLFLALFIAWWTGASQIGGLLPPSAALEIHVVAKQWMWKTQHPNGAREINALHVPLNESVRLIMTSQDVIHSFFVPAFRIKQDVVPGRVTQTWFEATQPGTFHLFCTQLCGTEHSRMVGDVVVMKPDDYARWAATQPQVDDLVYEGQQLYVSLGCSSCHDGAAGVKAPDLKNLFGHHVVLANGRTVVADDAYLTEAVLQPRDNRVAGYDPIMPSYSGLIGDDEIVRLNAYLRSLASLAGPAR